MNSEFQTVFFSQRVFHVLSMLHALEVREWSGSKSTTENEQRGEVSCSRYEQEDDLEGLHNFMESISKKV